MLTLNDVVAIVKPHNDKLMAEGRTADALATLRKITEIADEDGDARDKLCDIATLARKFVAKADGRS